MQGMILMMNECINLFVSIQSSNQVHNQNILIYVIRQKIFKFEKLGPGNAQNLFILFIFLYLEIQVK